MELPPFALERYFSPREFSAKALLSCSDCEAVAVDDLLAHASDDERAAWSSLKLGYTHTRGSPELRREIVELYAGDARGLGVDDVVAAVPSEGIFLAMHALVDAGDKVVVAMPGYQSLYEVARARGATVLPWMVRERAPTLLFHRATRGNET
jgi:aspartate/methionine/tyrosine aminotransferase